MPDPRMTKGKSVTKRTEILSLFRPSEAAKAMTTTKALALSMFYAWRRLTVVLCLAEKEAGRERELLIKRRKNVTELRKFVVRFPFDNFSVS